MVILAGTMAGVVTMTIGDTIHGEEVGMFLLVLAGVGAHGILAGADGVDGMTHGMTLGIMVVDGMVMVAGDQDGEMAGMLDGVMDIIIGVDITAQHGMVEIE